VERIREIVHNIFSDVLSRRKPLVEDDIGQYNRQFIDDFEPVFIKSFGRNGSRTGGMTLVQLVTELESINGQVSARYLHQGTARLSKYSEWMDKLDCNEFYQSKSYIEIPGQYEGSHFSHEPQIKKNIKIASFKKVCLVLGSIRRPKKITVHGSNEKDYNLLVKGGEDLRLDQRVE
jgi:DNA-dependent protein kinase catalytic subunit